MYGAAKPLAALTLSLITSRFSLLKLRFSIRMADRFCSVSTAFLPLSISSFDGKVPSDMFKVGYSYINIKKRRLAASFYF